MTLWIFHPKYLARNELSEIWREALKLQNNKEKILEKHRKKDPNPSKNILDLVDEMMFASNDPIKFIGHFLTHIYFDARSRKYIWNSQRIRMFEFKEKLYPINEATVQEQFLIFKGKMEKKEEEIIRRVRSEGFKNKGKRIRYFAHYQDTEKPESHPLFYIEQ